MAAPITDIDDAALAKSDVARHTGGAESESNLVVGAYVFIDERGERQIGQNIAAIDEKVLLLQMALGIFDSAARLKQHWFMQQGERPVAIKALA